MVSNSGSYWAHGKVALVVGNSDYEHHSPLSGVNKDVGAITNLLRNQLGFEVIFIVIEVKIVATTSLPVDRLTATDCNAARLC